MVCDQKVTENVSIFWKPVYPTVDPQIAIEIFYPSDTKWIEKKGKQMKTAENKGKQVTTSENKWKQVKTREDRWKQVKKNKKKL